MRHIYIFNRLSKGALYGVGTYIQQLLQLKRCGYTMHVVYLNSTVKEVTVLIEDGIEMIHFPNPALMSFERGAFDDWQRRRSHSLNRRVKSTNTHFMP